MARLKRTKILRIRLTFAELARQKELEAQAAKEAALKLKEKLDRTE